MGRSAIAGAGTAVWLILLLDAVSPAAGTDRFPRATLYPRALADPLETRLGLTGFRPHGPVSG